jgi:hypothetical protein
MKVLVTYSAIHTVEVEVDDRYAELTGFASADEDWNRIEKISEDLTQEVCKQIADKDWNRLCYIETMDGMCMYEE